MRQDQMDARHRRLLEENKLLKGLNEAQMDEVCAHLVRHSFARDALMIEVSQPADEVYLLVEGKAVVLRRRADGVETAVAELGPGDFFGEIAVLRGTGERSASVRAAGPVTVYSIRVTDFTPLLAAYPGLITNLLANLITHLQALNDRFLEMAASETDRLEEAVRERTRRIEAMNQRIQREFVLAQNIQKNLLPERRMSFPGVSIRTEYLPCEELGGDIMGVVPVDQDTIGVYGGDVCGHGIYAAMVMSYVKKLIETSFKRILLNRRYVVKPPGALLTSINQSFIREISQGDPEIYLTLFLGILDLKSLRFEHASAGMHVPPLVVSAKGVSELFEVSDFPIGHVEGHEYETRVSTLSRDDVFLFASDGVVEARRGDELFGMQRFKNEIARIVSEKGDLDTAEVLASVQRFLGSERPQDDICLLAMSFPEHAAAGEAPASRGADPV